MFKIIIGKYRSPKMYLRLFFLSGKIIYIGMGYLISFSDNYKCIIQYKQLCGVLAKYVIEWNHTNNIDIVLFRSK